MYRGTRRGVLGAVAVGLAGCFGADDDPEADDEDGDSEENPALAPARGDGDLQLRSPAFDDGDPIPRSYGYNEENVNPPLEISGVPGSAETLVLVVDDPDAVEVTGEIFVHWLVWNVPPETATVPEDWTPETAVEGENDFGELGYGGPAPPDEEHTYRFKCFALETSIDLGSGATVAELGSAMSGRVLEGAQLEGTYAP